MTRRTVKLSEPNEAPWESRKRRLAYLLFSVWLVASVASLVWMVNDVRKHATKITIHNAPIKMDFDWKCRLCGANNHITEEIGK